MRHGSEKEGVEPSAWAVPWRPVRRGRQPAVTHVPTGCFVAEKVFQTSNLKGNIMIRGGVTTLLVISTALASSSPSGGSTADDGRNRTEIILLGTLGSRHLETPTYSLESLRDIIVGCKPDLILIALPVPAEGQITPIAVDAVRQTRSHDPEVYVAAEAAQRTGAQLVCYDVPEQEAFLRQDQERRDRVDQRMAEWMNAMTRQETTNTVDLGTVRLALYLAKATTFHDTPRTVNFAGFDALVRQKYYLYHELIPQILLRYADFRSVASEWEKLATAWTSHNAAMAKNIALVARRYGGKRLVVAVGADHRYILRDLLEKQAGITLREYWETGTDEAESTPGNHSSGKTNTDTRGTEPHRRARTMEPQTVEKTMDVPVPPLSSGTFSLENFNGSIRLQAGTPERSKVSVTIKARAPTTERAQELVDGTRFDSREESGRVSLKVIRPEVREQNETLVTDFDIALPSQVAVQLATANGNVTVAGVGAKQQCRTQNGNIACHSVSSWTELITQNGNINLKCPTRSTMPSHIEARTRNGGVSLEGVENLSGTIGAEVSNGVISYPSSIVVEQVSKTQLRGRVGQVEGSIALATSNGNISIR